MNKKHDRKKILFLSNRGLLPIVDGHTRRSFNILKGLSENSAIYLLSLYESNEEIASENISELEKLCYRVEFFLSPPKKISLGMILRFLRSLISIEPYTMWRHYSHKYNKRVKELIKSENFDLIHCDILPLYYTVKDIDNKYISITDHDVSYLKCISMAKECKNFLLKLFLYIESWKLKILEKNIFKKIDLGIVVSEDDKNMLQKLSPEGNFLVIENGVDLERFNFSVDFKVKNRLLWLGGFNHFSNIQSIIHFLDNIYPLIKKLVPEVSIDIIGGGVTESLKKYSLRDPSVNFTGYVDDPLMYFDVAEIFVAPILSGGGTKLKVLEAMAAGCAVVTTSVGCEGIAGTHGRHYLVSDTVNGFVDNTCTLLGDDHLRKSLILNARNLVKNNHDYSNISKKINDFYDTIK